MMSQSDGERILMMHSAVLTQITSVTDRQMDGQTDGIGVAYTRYRINAVVRKNKSTCLIRQCEVGEVY